MTGSGTPLRDAVAEEIRALLGRRRLSAVRLARLAGVSQPYLSRRLSGRKALDLDDLELIAEALDVPVLKLFPDEMVRLRDVPLPRRPEPTRPPARGRQTNGPRGRRS